MNQVGGNLPNNQARPTYANYITTSGIDTNKWTKSRIYWTVLGISSFITGFILMGISGAGIASTLTLFPLTAKISIINIVLYSSTASIGIALAGGGIIIIALKTYKPKKKSEFEKWCEKNL